MKAITKALLSLPLAALASASHAQLTANATLVVGGPTVHAFGFDFSLPEDGKGSLTFSKELIGAVSVMGAETTFTAPASGTVKPSAITFDAPVLSVSGTFAFDGSGEATFAGNHVRTLGGLKITTNTTNFATTGGFVALENISVDLATQRIYATMSGANGVVTQNAVHVWDYSNIEGSDFGIVNRGALMEMPRSEVVADLRLSGLTIKQDAFDLLAQGLGLQPGGIAALSGVSDYGVMTIAIPEPSTYLMMGLGLTGIAMLSRGRRSA